MRASKPDTVAVTGGAGYIGSVLVRRLLADGYRVRVIDNLMWGGHALVELTGHPHFAFHNADIREGAALPDILKGCRAVVHLAGLAGEAACQADPDLARHVNVHGSASLHVEAERAGCSRYILASSCAVYPRACDRGEFVDEQSPVAPVSICGQTLAAAERLLLGVSRDCRCRPTILRLASAHGMSPRMRFDLPLHHIVRDAWLGREPLAVSSLSPWLTCCHVQDIARAVCRVLESPDRTVAFEIFNVGDTAENHAPDRVLQEIARHVGAAAVHADSAGTPAGAPRVKCDKIRERLGFHVSRRLADAVGELIRALSSGLITDPDDEHYTNTLHAALAAAH